MVSLESEPLAHGVVHGRVVEQPEVSEPADVMLVVLGKVEMTFSVSTCGQHEQIPYQECNRVVWIGRDAGADGVVLGRVEQRCVAPRVQVLDPNTALVEERGERAAFLYLDEPLDEPADTRSNGAPVCGVPR